MADNGDTDSSSDDSKTKSDHEFDTTKSDNSDVIESEDVSSTEYTDSDAEGTPAPDISSMISRLSSMIGQSSVATPVPTSTPAPVEVPKNTPVASIPYVPTTPLPSYTPAPSPAPVPVQVATTYDVPKTPLPSYSYKPTPAATSTPLVPPTADTTPVVTVVETPKPFTPPTTTVIQMKRYHVIVPNRKENRDKNPIHPIAMVWVIVRAFIASTNLPIYQPTTFENMDENGLAYALFKFVDSVSKNTLTPAELDSAFETFYRSVHVEYYRNWFSIANIIMSNFIESQDVPVEVQVETKVETETVETEAFNLENYDTEDEDDDDTSKVLDVASILQGIASSSDRDRGTSSTFSTITSSVMSIVQKIRLLYAANLRFALMPKVNDDYVNVFRIIPDSKQVLIPAGDYTGIKGIDRLMRVVLDHFKFDTVLTYIPYTAGMSIDARLRMGDGYYRHVGINYPRTGNILPGQIVGLRVSDGPNANGWNQICQFRASFNYEAWTNGSNITHFTKVKAVLPYETGVVGFPGMKTHKRYVVYPRHMLCGSRVLDPLLGPSALVCASISGSSSIERGPTLLGNAILGPASNCKVKFMFDGRQVYITRVESRNSAPEDVQATELLKKMAMYLHILPSSQIPIVTRDMWKPPKSSANMTVLSVPRLGFQSNAFASFAAYSNSTGVCSLYGGADPESNPLENSVVPRSVITNLFVKDAQLRVASNALGQIIDTLELTHTTTLLNEKRRQESNRGSLGVRINSIVDRSTFEQGVYSDNTHTFYKIDEDPFVRLQLIIYDPNLIGLEGLERAQDIAIRDVDTNLWPFIEMSTMPVPSDIAKRYKTTVDRLEEYLLFFEECNLVVKNAVQVLPPPKNDDEKFERARTPPHVYGILTKPGQKVKCFYAMINQKKRPFMFVGNLNESQIITRMVPKENLTYEQLTHHIVSWLERFYQSGHSVEMVHLNFIPAAVSAAYKYTLKSVERTVGHEPQMPTAASDIRQLNRLSNPGVKVVHILAKKRRYNNYVNIVVVLSNKVYGTLRNGSFGTMNVSSLISTWWMKYQRKIGDETSWYHNRHQEYIDKYKAVAHNFTKETRFLAIQINNDVFEKSIPYLSPMVMWHMVGYQRTPKKLESYFRMHASNVDSVQHRAWLMAMAPNTTILTIIPRYLSINTSVERGIFPEFHIITNGNQDQMDPRGTKIEFVMSYHSQQHTWPQTHPLYSYANISTDYYSSEPVEYNQLFTIIDMAIKTLGPTPEITMDIRNHIRSGEPYRPYNGQILTFENEVLRRALVILPDMLNSSMIAVYRSLLPWAIHWYRRHHASTNSKTQKRSMYDTKTGELDFTHMFVILDNLGHVVHTAHITENGTALNPDSGGYLLPHTTNYLDPNSDQVSYIHISSDKLKHAMGPRKSLVATPELIKMIKGSYHGEERDAFRRQLEEYNKNHYLYFEPPPQRKGIKYIVYAHQSEVSFVTNNWIIIDSGSSKFEDLALMRAISTVTGYRCINMDNVSYIPQNVPPPTVNAKEVFERLGFVFGPRYDTGMPQPTRFVHSRAFDIVPDLRRKSAAEQRFDPLSNYISTPLYNVKVQK